MPRRRGPRPSVRKMNKQLIGKRFGQRVKKQGRPLGTRQIDREPSIPQMHPEIKYPSRYRRTGRPIVTKTVEHKVLPLRVFDPYLRMPVIQLTRVPVTTSKTKYNVVRVSKKRGGGFGGGKKPPEAIERRPKRSGVGHPAKASGTRGAKPGREPKKEKKK